MNDFVVKNGLQLGGSVKGSVGTVTGNATLDLSTGSAFEVVPTADVTFAFSNPPAAGNAQSFNLALTGAEVGASYDIANAVYDSVNFNYSSQMSYSVAVALSADNTKAFLLTSGPNVAVYQYTLSTPLNISTASYDSVSFSVSAQSTNPRGFFFKPDGLKMYVADGNSNVAYQYTLSTAWDISTASYDSVSFSVSAQGGNLADVQFKPDGLKMYAVNLNNDSVYQYSLSTAWDISTASYDSVSFSVSAQDGLPYGLLFKSDGSKMYIVGGQNSSLFQYTLSTAWDISTASYDSVSFSVSAQETSPTGAFFNSDGTKMYVVGFGAAFISQYTTGTSDIATITYPASVKWPSGTTPTAPADGETDLLTFYTDDGGTTYYGIQRGDNMAPVPPEPMVLIYNTALSAGTTVVLPLAGTVDVTVDWGDGSVEDFTTAGDKTHTYATEGTYTVEMTGTLTGFGSESFPNKDKLTRVTSWGDLEFTLTSLVEGFRDCSNLTEVPTTLPSGVTNINSMFRSASAFNQNIGSWNVANVTNMSFMFLSASAFNQNIGSWNVANVTNMSVMFQSASAFNNGGSADINNWDVSKVTNMTNMFQSASAFNQNIGSWNVDNVTGMSNMFRSATAMTFPLGSWQTKLSGQPSDFSTDANATFVAFRGTANFPLLADTVTRINT